jgi:hypothetical protein
VWSFTVNLPTGAQSFRYGFLAGGNASGYPAAITVASSGIAVNGNPGSVNAGGTIAFGQTIAITVVPFTGLSGTGSTLTAIELRGSYLTFTASKTANYSPGSFVERTNPPWGSTLDSDGNFEMDGSLTSSDQQIASNHLLVPSGTTGVTLTQIAVDINYGTALGHPTSVNWTFERKSGSGVGALIASGSASSVGWQTVTGSLSENSAGRSYIVEVIRHGGTFGPVVGNCAVTYTMGDPKQAL